MDILTADMRLFPVIITVTTFEKTYGWFYDDRAVEVQPTGDGGYVFAGTTYRVGTSDIVVVKVDSAGKVNWKNGLIGSSQFGVYLESEDSYSGVSIIKNSIEEYFVLGNNKYYWFPMTQYLNYFLIKFDSLGNILMNTCCLFGYGLAGDMILSSDTEVVVSDNFDYYYGCLDKVNSSGIVTGSIGCFWYLIEGFDKTIDNGYILMGNRSNIYYLSGDIWLAKTDSIGDTIWTKTIHTSDSIAGYSIRQTADSGFIIAGKLINSGYSDILLMKVNNNGDTVWTKKFGGFGNDAGNHVALTNDGGFIITGNMTSKAFLLKTDSYGNSNG